MYKEQIAYGYPILLFLIGIVIHIANIVLLVVGAQKFSLWAWGVHLSMLVFNLAILAGLIRRARIAHLAAAAGLTALILFQAAHALLTGEISLAAIGGWSLSAVAIPLLLHSGRSYGKTTP